MPNAAHKRSDRTCGGIDRSLYSRVDLRSASASISGIPPLLRGARNAIVFASFPPNAGPPATAALDKMPGYRCGRGGPMNGAASKA